MVFTDILDKLNETYIAKNADYGDSFNKLYNEFGLTSSVIRLSDKLNRLKTLNVQAAKVKDESIDDTLLDLANYAILTYLIRNKDKSILNLNLIEPTEQLSEGWVTFRPGDMK